MMEIPTSKMAETVHRLISDCLYDTSSDITTEEDIDYGVVPANAVRSEGIVRTFAFDPAKLNKPEVKETVVALIKNIHKHFLKESEGGGGGWSFLNLPMTTDQQPWGEQPTAEELFCLAQALGMAGTCMPKPMWELLPGGVPYVWFSLGNKSDELSTV